MNCSLLVLALVLLSVSTTSATSMGKGFAVSTKTEAIADTTNPDPLVETATPSPSTSPAKCPKRFFRLGGACQCHLIKILAIQLFKRISFEGQILGCISRFGPKRTWKRACLRLTRTRSFKKKRSIRIVSRIVDKCGFPLCRFSVRT